MSYGLNHIFVKRSEPLDRYQFDYKITVQYSKVLHYLTSHILMCLLSAPNNPAFENWDSSLEELIEILYEDPTFPILDASYGKIRKSLIELEQMHFLKRFRTRDWHGRYAQTIWIVSDRNDIDTVTYDVNENYCITELGEIKPAKGKKDELVIDNMVSLPTNAKDEFIEMLTPARKNADGSYAFDKNEADLYLQDLCKLSLKDVALDTPEQLDTLQDAYYRRLGEGYIPRQIERVYKDYIDIYTKSNGVNYKYAKQLVNWLSDTKANCLESLEPIPYKVAHDRRAKKYLEQRHEQYLKDMDARYEKQLHSELIEHTEYLEKQEALANLIKQSAQLLQQGNQKALLACQDQMKELSADIKAIEKKTKAYKRYHLQDYSRLGANVKILIPSF